jgi:hypothetical protein
MMNKNELSNTGFLELTTDIFHFLYQLSRQLCKAEFICIMQHKATIPRLYGDCQSYPYVLRRVDHGQRIEQPCFFGDTYTPCVYTMILRSSRKISFEELSQFEADLKIQRKPNSWFQKYDPRDNTLELKFTQSELLECREIMIPKLLKLIEDSESFKNRSRG